MAGRLTRMDEWPRHQTIHTFDSIASSSPQWSDGYYFTLGHPDGDAALFTAIRLYPNTNVLDGYALAIRKDTQRQYNMRFSRRLRPDIDNLAVGALWMEILEGLKTIRFGANANPYGIEFDLLWDGFSPCYNEDHRPMYADGRLLNERANYVQVGNVSGSLTIAGKTFAVDEGWSGVRDHSWGIGETGGPAYPHAAPIDARPRPFGFRQWVLIRFPGRAVYFQFHQDPDGTTTMFESLVNYPYGDDRAPWTYRGVRILSYEFAEGKRRLKRAELAFKRPDGGEDRFGMEAMTPPLYMSGGGYWGGFNDGLGRGAYRGIEHHEGESWDVSTPTDIGWEDGTVRRSPRSGWAETWARFWNLDDPSETGTGHLECVIMGSYPGITD